MKERALNLEEELEIQETANVSIGKFLNKMTDWYFKPKSFEKSGKLYKNLGVKGIKKCCELIGRGLNGENPKNPQNYSIWDKSKEGLKKFDYVARFNEAFHLLGGVYIGAVAINDFLKDDSFCRMDAGAFVLSAYLVMLQRYNRARLHNVIEKMEARDNLRSEYKEVQN